MRGEADLAGLLGGANPNRALTADEREGIVADERGRAAEFETDGVCGEGADGVELVGNTEDDAGRVGPIGNELNVVRKQHEFLIDSLTGETARDDLLALNVSFDAQIAPWFEMTAQFGGEGRVLEMRKLLAVGIGLGHQLTANIELEMIAVG